MAKRIIPIKGVDHQASQETPTPAVDGHKVLLDNISELHLKLRRLEALMTMTYGDAQETFDLMHNDLKDHYLWHCAEIVGECRVLADAVEDVAYKAAWAGHEKVVAHG